MPVSNPKKEVSSTFLNCADTLKVTLSFDAAADLVSFPSDIVLIMDRSGSMTDERMKSAKLAALQLIDKVASASGTFSQFQNNTRMGLVSFSDTASEDVSLTGNADLIRSSVRLLSQGGFTNHKAAFECAGKMLSSSAVRKVVVMFTDGDTTTGGDPQPAAELLKQQNAEIFCIGLTDDPSFINLWATDPADTHVVYSDFPAKLPDLFDIIAARIVKAGAQNAVITEEVTKDFEILKIDPPSAGTAKITGTRSLLWDIGNAGFGKNAEKISLSFYAAHIGSGGGKKKVNESVVYEDLDHNTLEFPVPFVTVSCGEPAIFPDPCPEPVLVATESCQDHASVLLPDQTLSGLGRIIETDVTLLHVCPNKKLAAAVYLTEQMENGEEKNRGIKFFTVGPFEQDQCQNVTLRCIRFVVPEEDSGDPHSLCKKRNFLVRVLANYTDTDFECCKKNTFIL